MIYNFYYQLKMKSSPGLFLLLVLLFNSVQTDETIPYRNVMYYGDWSIYAGQNNFYPSYMNPNLLTHINFAFLGIDLNGDLIITDEHADFLVTSLPELDGMDYGAPYAGVIGALAILRIKYPHLKIGISVGGWSMSSNFSPVCADESKRKNFAKNIVKFIDYIGYDFVDIDWEYPSTDQDTINFNLLLQDIRSELDTLGKKYDKYYELSIAMSAAPSNMAKIQYDKVLQIVDFSNMMTYDLAGGWSSYTAHHTGLYTNEAYDHGRMGDAIFSADYCIKYLENTYGNTIDYKKVLIGVAPYTRGWAGVKNDGLDPNSPGLFASATPNSAPSMDGSTSGTWAFHQIPSIMQQFGLQEYFDNTAKAAYYYGNGYFFTCDNEKSVAAKGQYVRDKKLGGLIAWMASLDAENVVTKAMMNSLYGDGYDFPENKLVFPNMGASAKISVINSGYEITISNLENAVETNTALKDAELLQKSIVFMKIYIKTKSGAIFSPGEMSGTVTNENGVGIVDPSSFYDAKNISPGESYTFSVKVDRTADIADIESITLTQRILSNLKEMREQVIYKN